MLKAGTETGSLVNHLYSRSGDPEPVIGMGATALHWTDREPYEIVGINRTKAGAIKSLTLRALKATRTDSHGMSEAQSYSFESWPEQPTVEARLTRRGYMIGGVKGTMVKIGHAAKYHDFSF